ncbi:MAG TPA: TonB-dependent receptor [Pyrinomonadaceae bacterium]|jgi:outer membrane receptor protein involved in Fe transport
MSHSARSLLVAVLLMLAAAMPAPAQSQVDGAISGTVTDPNGAVVPNATVTVRNDQTNKEQTAATDSEGRFRVPQLQPGNYTVRVTASGFGEAVQPNVVVEVGRINSIELALGVAGTTETVEVTSEAPVINTERQDFSTNINQTSINELPINGRRVSNFVLLTPGVAPDGDFGLVSFRGVSGLLNNNTIDGGDNNQAFFSEERGRTRIGYGISQSAIREFQVNTSNYSSEYGRAAGGVVNQVTKSGSNEFHGQIFYYNRNNRFGARNPLGFQNVLVNGVVERQALKPTDVRHQFGGNIGGRIIRDKLFFFFNYDEQRRNFPGIATTAQANAFVEAPANSNGVNRTTLKARGLTDAQIDAGVAFLVSLTGEVPRRQDQRIYLPKIDWNINQSNTFTSTLNVLRADSPAGIQTQPTTTRGIRSFGDDFVDSETWINRLTSTISPSLLNEARFLYSRDFEYAFSQEPAPGEPTTGPGGRPPQVSIQNFLDFGKPNFLERNANPDERRYQVADTVTFNRGNHTLKFGGDINHVNDRQDNLFREGGEYFYNSINDFLVDYTNFTTSGALRTAGRLCATNTRVAGLCYSGNYRQGFGPSVTQFTTTDYNLFVQDDWRAARRLTLNLGLRYEYQRLPSAPAAPIPQLAGNTLTLAPATFPDDRNNFGPRVGFAYDVSNEADGKTVVRGGYGIYYGRIQGSYLSSAINGTGNPAGQQQFEVAASVAGAPIFPFVLEAPGNRPQNLAFFAPGYRSPVIHQYDLILEHQIARNTVISVSYVGSQGGGLPSFVDINLAPPTVNRTFTFAGGPFNGQTISVPTITARRNAAFGAVTMMTSDVDSQYSAFIFQANRRFTNGLQFQANYTFSQARDNGQISQTFTPTTGNSPANPFDRLLDWGVSNFDVPHRTVVSAVWTPGKNFGLEQTALGRTIFNGFTISPVVTIQNGRPYSANTSGTPTGAVASGVFGSGGDAFLPNTERNEFRRPTIYNLDLRLSRRFNLGETKNIEILAEGFNVFNRTHITDVNFTQYNTSGANVLNANSAFGTVRTTGNSLFRERQIQFAARFEF